MAAIDPRNRHLALQAMGELPAIMAVQPAATSVYKQALRVFYARPGARGAQQGRRVHKMQQACHAGGVGGPAELQGHIPALHQPPARHGCHVAEWRHQAAVPGVPTAWVCAQVFLCEVYHAVPLEFAHLRASLGDVTMLEVSAR